MIHTVYKRRMSTTLTNQLKGVVRRLTAGYGESHNHEHAEKVANNATQIFSLTEMSHDLQEKGG